MELKLVVWWLVLALPKLNPSNILNVNNCTIVHCQILIHQIFKKQFLSMPPNIMTTKIFSNTLFVLQIIPIYGNSMNIINSHCNTIYERSEDAFELLSHFQHCTR